MPALDKLRERLNSDLAWREAYERALPDAKIISSQIFFIHATRSTVLEIMLSPSSALTPHKQSTTGKTQETEDLLGIGRNIYFYVGKVMPIEAGGGAAFAFDRLAETSLPGYATSFDTGGLLKHCTLDIPIGAARNQVLTEFIYASSFPISQWRDPFCDFIAAYFTHPSAYWTERPVKSDPDNIFLNPKNSWRMWTWEIRASVPIALTEASLWCCDEYQLDQLRHTLTLITPNEAARLDGFLDRALNIRGDMSYLAALEDEVKRRSLTKENAMQ